MRPFRLLNCSLAVVIVLFTFAATTSSVFGAVALSDLIMSEGSIVSGDKLFDQFMYSGTGDMPASSDVQVMPITILGNHGIRLFSGFYDLSGGGASTATVSYRVSSLDPTMGVNGSQLYGNPAVLRSGLFTIEASFASLDLPTQLVIFDQIPGGTKLADSVSLNSVYPSLTVEVNLTGDSTSETGAVTASFVDQTFSQGVVPEPQSLLIWMGSALVFGAVTIVHRRWALNFSRP